MSALRGIGFLLAVGATLLVWQARTPSQTPAFDVVVRGGRIVDGTGNPWFVADVGVKGDTIAAVAPALDAGGARVVEARGLVVSPGFIDVHSHAEARDDGQDIVGNPGAENDVRQGVTTIIASPDGGGSVQVAAYLVVPDEHLEAEGGRLGVYPVGAAHHHAVLVLECHRRKGDAQVGHPLQDDLHCLRHLKGECCVNHV